MGCITSLLKKNDNIVINDNSSNIPFIHYEIYENYLKNFIIIKRYEFNEYVYKVLENKRTYILKINYTKKSFEREYNILNKVRLVEKTINLYKVIEFSERDIFQGGLILYNYIPGIDLFTYLVNNNDISILSKKIIFKNIVKVVKNIHDIGVFHGDIKLENIICKYNNYRELYLIDFGLSRECEINVEYQINKCFGTAPYIAPELYNNYYCLKSDIWSLGCILYILIFNCLPFSNNKLQYQIIQNDIHNFINKIKNTSKHLDNSLFELIFGMLEPDLKKRFNIEEIINHNWFNT